MRMSRPDHSTTIFRKELARIFPGIWRYALSLTGNRAEADDPAQSASLQAMERANQFEPGTHLDRWVFRITHDLWMSELRRQKVRKGNGLIGIEVAEIVDPRQNAEMQAERRELLQSVLNLPEAQRQAVVLVYVEGHSYRDAAMILDVPVGTVMSRLAAARANLSHKLKTRKGGRNAG